MPSLFPNQAPLRELSEVLNVDRKKARHVVTFSFVLTRRTIFKFGNICTGLQIQDLVVDFNTYRAERGGKKKSVTEIQMSRPFGVEI